MNPRTRRLRKHRRAARRGRRTRRVTYSAVTVRFGGVVLEGVRAISYAQKPEQRVRVLTGPRRYSWTFEVVRHETTGQGGPHA